MLLCILAAAGCAPGSPPDRASHPHSVRQQVLYPASRKEPARPELIRLRNGHYRVKRPWTVELDGRRWTIPRGYSSNGMTCPSWMKSSLGDGVDHPETWSAVFHDWLFTQPGISRSRADGLFYDLLIAYGVPAQKARLMHASVSAYSLSKRFE
jgi:hypothetical protein